MKNSKPLLVLCTLAVPVTVMAEDVALGTMVVTARRAEAKIEETPQRIEIIGTEQIESTPSLDLTDTLKKNSSVDVIQYPGNLSGIGIRGFRPEFSGINKHSLLLIDGRPAMGTNLSLINMDRVERIEVLKGPASALYGSQAMGGVVNVITRESKGPLNGFGQIAYGSYDTKQLKGAIGGALNEFFDFDYSGSYLDRGDDFKAGGGVLRPSTSYGQQYHALRLGLNLNKDWRANLKTDIYIGRDIATPGDIAYGTNSQSNKDMDRNGTDLSVTGKMGNHRLLARAFMGQEAYTLYNKTSRSAADRPYLPFRSFESDIQWTGAQLQDTWNWSESASLVFGVDHEKAKVESRSWAANGKRKGPYSADHEQRTIGIYAENTWYLNDNNSTVYVGVRHDKIRTKSLDTPFKTGFTPSTAEFGNTSPSAGFKHLIGHGFRVHGTVGKGFVAPSASNVSGYTVSTQGRSIQITRGNPDLKPESSLTYDIGLEWSNPTFYADLTMFHTKVTDKISNRITTINRSPLTNLSTYYNANEARMHGLEWTGRWDVNKIIRLSLSGTHYFSRQEENNGKWTDIHNVPRTTVRAAVEANYGAWDGRLGLRRVGQWYDNNWVGNTAEVVRFPGFTTMDLFVRYRFNKHHSLSLSIENLADKYYEEKGGYPLPGRNGKIAYRYDF